MHKVYTKLHGSVIRIVHLATRCTSLQLLRQFCINL
jgi:hypothetical protein